MVGGALCIFLVCLFVLRPRAVVCVPWLVVGGSGGARRVKAVWLWLGLRWLAGWLAVVWLVGSPFFLFFFFSVLFFPPPLRVFFLQASSCLIIFKCVIYIYIIIYIYIYIVYKIYDYI